MTRPIKRALLVVAGLCWVAVALGFGFILFEYIAGGAGLQVFGFFLGVAPTTVLIGLVHVVGLTVAALLSFAIGAGLCAYGLAPPDPVFSRQP